MSTPEGRTPPGGADGHVNPGAASPGGRPPAEGLVGEGVSRAPTAAAGTAYGAGIDRIPERPERAELPPAKGDSNDPLWENTLGAWGMDMAALIVLGVICGFFVARFLRRHEPEVMRK